MATTATIPALPVRRWTRAEYSRLVELGFFEDERLELLDGHLVVREPQSHPHAAAIRRVRRALRRAFPDDLWQIDSQAPIALDDDSEPEPDVSVVPRADDDYASGHPTRPVLIVEVAASSYRVDRYHKTGLYARAGIADYWIVDLERTTVEVHRGPEPWAEAPLGWRYARIDVLRTPAAITPLAAPAAVIAVADLLA